MEINDVVTEILKSKKYSSLDPKFVETICISLSHRFSGKQLLETTKSKLHQIWGSYYTTRPDFTKLLKKYQENEVILSELLRIHQSTKERLGEYDEIINFVFENTEHKSILDIGCGFNPIYLSQIKDFDKYIGVDIDIQQQEFLKEVLSGDRSMEIRVGSSFDNFEHVDLVFALKILPVLDQIEEGNSQKFLLNLKTKFLVVSFPSRSISGKSKGMLENYREKYIPLIESAGFTQLFEKAFSSESVYIFKKASI